MKTRIATVISLAGVLVAGSAAALVNTQVLSGGSKAEAASGQPEVYESTTTTVLLVPPQALPLEAPPVSTQATYQIGEAGTVTLDTAGDVLTIVSAVPNTGWVVTEAENDDATDVEVKFLNGDLEVEFHANLLLGIVSTSVESRYLGGNTDSDSDTSDDTPSGGTSYDDDDDQFDDDDDDEFDDEDDEDDEIDDEDDDEDDEDEDEDSEVEDD